LMSLAAEVLARARPHVPATACEALEKCLGASAAPTQSEPLLPAAA
jgi:hypothetical protein